MGFLSVYVMGSSISDGLLVMDPVDSALERDFGRIMCLITRTASDTKTMTVRINAIEAILERNSLFRHFSGFQHVLEELHKARETLQAQKLAELVCSRGSTSKLPQQQTELATEQRQQQAEHAADQRQRLL